ncbi:hypothetical protein DRN74_05110 [Candidatus Micrarchaeota archaeon]|nr:MAG: hypothetical protein DRN74_05110 [Candidatus Micrarchaeota archaeon]
MSEKNSWAMVLKIIVSLIAFYAILRLSKLRLEWVSLHLSSVNVYYLCLAFLVYLLAVIVLGIRWKRAIAIFQEISLKEAIREVYVSLFSSIIVPARMGDFVKTVLLKRTHKTVKRKSVCSVILEKSCDLFWMLSLSLLAILFLFFFFKPPSSLFLQFAVSGAVIFLLMLMLVVFASQNHIAISVLLKMPVVKRHYKIIRNYLPIAFKQSNFFTVLAITMLAWLLGAFRVWLCAQSLGINISYFYLVLFLPLIYVISLLPISAGGLGAVDLVGVFIYSMIGISSDYAMALMILDRLTSFLPSVIIGFILTVSTVSQRK